MRLQSAIEILSVYGWTILVVMVVIAILLSVTFFRAPQQYLQSSCNINVGFPCSNSAVFAYNSIEPIRFRVIFLNQLDTPVSFPSGAVNLTIAGIGSQEELAYAGSCSPSIAPVDSQVTCTVGIPGTYEPNVGSTLTDQFTIQYSICATISPSSCTGNYETSGYSVQTLSGPNSNPQTIPTTTTSTQISTSSTTTVSTTTSTSSSSTSSSSSSTSTSTTSILQISGCGSLPSSIASLFVACVPANIVNSRSSATPTNFQQEFANTPFNALSGNVVVYNGISGGLMPAWIESNSIIWVNLGSNTISATSSANGVYYFGLGSASTNFFISGNNMGEAPQLSSTYAQYDNGNIVFPFYDNFAGSSLNTNLWKVTTLGVAGGNTLTVNNGITLSVTTGSTNNGIAISSVNTYNAIYYTLDILGNQIITSQADSPTRFAFWDEQAVQSPTGSDKGFSITTGTSSREEIAVYSGVTAAATYFSTQPAGTVLYSIYGNSIAGSATYNYGNHVSASPTGYAVGNFINEYVEMQLYPSTGGANSISANYIRLRISPPNGVMPSVTYGTQVT